MKYLLILTCLGSLSLFGQNKTFDPQKSSSDLYQFAEFIGKGKKNFTINEVLKNPDFFQGSQPLESDNHSIGFTSDNYWVRFKLENSSDQTQTYYLETARPVTDVAELFIQNKKSIQSFRSGDQLAFEERQVAHRATIFKLDLPPKSTTSVLLHLKSDGETINIPLNLYSESEFWIMNYNQQLFLGLFYGLLLLAGVVYLFFYGSLKKEAFLYYGFYVFSIGLLQAALDGMIFQYILPSGGYLNSRAVLVTALLSNFFLLKYCEHFLGIRNLPRYLQKLYNIIYGVIAVLGIMIFFNANTLEWTYPIANMNGLFSLLMILFTIFILRHRKVAIDNYFSFGIFFLVVGLLGFVMNNLSMLPNNFYTLNSAKFGAGMEVIFLSLSMTNLIKKLRVEKELSQQEALERSEEISQLKSYFMSNISHELRTPINAIMGIADSKLKSPLKNSDREPFEIIKSASLSLLSHVNDILDFEKIEKNELHLNNEEFSLKMIVRQIHQNWNAQASKKNIQFNYSIAREVPKYVKSDPERLSQILNHLLSNAVKFTHEGQVNLHLETSNKSENECLLSIKVSDSGVGMDAHAVKKAFSSFNQMRRNHSREFGGIGLGLTIVKHLTELFGGQISVQSEPGKGTEICIDLPMQIIELKDQGNSKKTDASLAHLSKVLVVEDNRMNQMVIKRILQNLKGVAVTIANNGKEGLDILRQENFDMILMDLQMPVMDGYEATNHIRNGKLGVDLADIPIIAVTADATQETKQRILDIGIDAMITKPIQAEQLYQKMALTLERHALKIA